MLHPLLQLASLLLVSAFSASANAADGCKVLLCLAAPSWRNIGECHPPIHEVMRDLARGRPFPVCTMAGSGNDASHEWANPPANCPPQYTSVINAEPPVYYCRYDGAITTVINGAWFTKTWWNFGGNTVTEFSATARTTLGTWDTRFDDEYAAWLASLPPAAPSDGNP